MKSAFLPAISASLCSIFERFPSRMVFAALSFIMASGQLPAAPGDVDRRFGTGGYVFSNALADGTDMAVQTDGKILVCGYSAYGPENDSYQFSIARFTARGVPDPICRTALWT